MKTDHTPEPLHYMPLPAADGTFMVLGGQGQDYGLVASCTTEEDARRIVACVNACSGIPDEQLYDQEPGCLLSAMVEQEQEIMTITKQRDELLAALKEAIDAVRVFHGPVDWETYRDHSPEMKRWQAAIASVKEKQNAADR